VNSINSFVHCILYGCLLTIQSTEKNRKLSDSIFICILKMNKNLMGLEQREGE